MENNEAKQSSFWGDFVILFSQQFDELYIYLGNTTWWPVWNMWKKKLTKNMMKNVVVCGPEWILQIKRI